MPETKKLNPATLKVLQELCTKQEFVDYIKESCERNGYSSDRFSLGDVNTQVKVDPFDLAWKGQLGIYEQEQRQVFMDKETPKLLTEPLKDLTVFFVFKENDETHVQYLVDGQLLEVYLGEKDTALVDRVKEVLNEESINFLKRLGYTLSQEGKILLDGKAFPSTDFIKKLNESGAPIKESQSILSENLQNTGLLKKGETVIVRGMNTSMQYVLGDNDAVPPNQVLGG
jgi:hypothetical protein